MLRPYNGDPIPTASASGGVFGGRDRTRDRESRAWPRQAVAADDTPNVA